MIDQSKEITVSRFQEHDIRTIRIDGDLWYVLKDFCVVLGIANPKQAANRLDQNGVSQTEVTDSMRRTQNAIIITRANLILFLSRSNKPEAFSLLDWMYQQIIAASQSPDIVLLQAQNAQLLQQNTQLLEQNHTTMQLYLQRIESEIEEGSEVLNPKNKLMQDADLEDWVRLYTRLCRIAGDLNQAKKITAVQYQEMMTVLNEGLRVVKSHLTHLDGAVPVADGIWERAYYGVQDAKKQQQAIQTQTEQLRTCIQYALPAVPQFLQIEEPKKEVEA